VTPVISTATLLLAALVPAGAAGSDGVASFLERARAAAAPYRDRRVAIAEGYRRIGGDFPGMGEHWIHIGRVFDGRLDPERPEVLSYVVLHDVPTLTGVAWIVPLLEGEPVPEFPAPAALWHEHVGSLDDETLAPRHDRSGRGEGARLAMLHTWIWVANPEGPFAADNWALPWRRLGREPPPAAPAASGRALSLVGPTQEYWTAMVRGAGGGDAGAAVALLSRARARVQALLGEDPPDLAERLARVWAELCDAIGVVGGPELRERMAGAAHAHH